MAAVNRIHPEFGSYPLAKSIRAQEALLQDDANDGWFWLQEE